MLPLRNQHSFYMGVICRPPSASFQENNLTRNVYYTTAAKGQLREMKQKHVLVATGNAIKLKDEMHFGSAKEVLSDDCQLIRQGSDKSLKLANDEEARDAPNIKQDQLRITNLEKPQHFQIEHSYMRRPKSSHRYHYSSMSYQAQKQIYVQGNSNTSKQMIRVNSESQVRNSPLKQQPFYPVKHPRKGSFQNRSSVKARNSARAISMDSSHLSQTQYVGARNIQVQKLNQLLKKNVTAIVLSPSQLNEHQISQNSPTKGQVQQQSYAESARHPNNQNLEDSRINNYSQYQYKFSNQLNMARKGDRGNQTERKISPPKGMRVVQEYIKPKIIKIIENEEYRDELTESLIERTTALYNRKPSIHRQHYESANMARYAKSHRPKKGLSIGNYRQTETTVKVIHKAKMVVNSQCIKNVRNIDVKYMEIMELGIDGLSISEILKEKRAQRHKTPRQMSRAVPPRERVFEEIDPKPWGTSNQKYPDGIF